MQISTDSSIIYELLTDVDDPPATGLDEAGASELPTPALDCDATAVF